MIIFFAQVQIFQPLLGKSVQALIEREVRNKMKEQKIEKIGPVRRI
jgi:hypothetical protein